MFPSRYVLTRTSFTTTVLAATAVRLAPSSRKPRRRRRSSKEKATYSASSPPHVSATAATASGGISEVDEVERLLAVTATRASPPLLPPIQTPIPPTSMQEKQTNVNPVVSPSEVSAEVNVPSVLDSASVLHFNAVHDATTTALRGGVQSHARQEQIERRRSKLSLAEAEFELGITERLVPELPRLPALHEVHYGDAVVRELDRSSYFSTQQQSPLQQSSSHPKTATSTVVIDGASYVEVSLDNDLSEADFAAFDAEKSANGTGAREGEESRRKDNATSTTSTAGQRSQEAHTSGHAVEEIEIDEDGGEDTVALSLTFGMARPWFVPASGVVALEPLPPSDCALLLRFLLYLRQQSVTHLVPTLRRALRQAEMEENEKENEEEAPEESGRSVKNTNQKSNGHALNLADINRYLDTAPPPVIGFTESLPTSTASSPAFVFHLYLENVSSQNAIGHLATLFGLPQRCFQSHSAVSKMSCTTVLCAVAENRLRREHLLLLNTLRHPGFVLRVSSIQEVPPDRYNVPPNSNDKKPHAGPAVISASVSEQLFGELARWQPLYETELLLRRVCSDKSSGAVSTRQQLEHRLRAVQTLGAICFCANREASLARAATDVLHGFFKSALLNALQRRKAPMPLQRFLKRPNVVTAQHAHHVSTDPTVRQVLKAFVQTNGDWHATVARTPYVWRRRWINALRGLVWNTMASQRLRKAGREVCIGDVVLKPAFRQDVHRRGIVTVKAEHVMVITTQAEADAASLDDVFIPFLRGRYPECLFAAEETNHPIMTRTNMLALLRAMHAPQLLLGLTDEVRLLLDVRAESSPPLFRRLIVRPVEMHFAILEDKPPMHALHYDAARLLSNDRWAAAVAAVTGAPQPQPKQLSPSSSFSTTHTAPRARVSHLISPSEVLERTTLGSRLTSGVLAEDFFAVPSPEEYVVLGHAYRHLSGDLASAAPHSNMEDIGDRVYTVYVRAVAEYNLAGLSNMLREYFLLSGIETEADSALQHKVHRMRRELDPETALLTAPLYCTTCFNRDHDTQEQCAEYQFKLQRRGAQRDLSTVVSAGTTLSMLSGDGSALQKITEGNMEGEEEMRDTHLLDKDIGNSSEASCTVRMRWHLRRRNDEQRWGVHLTKALHLVGLEDVQLIREGAVWSENGEEETKKGGTRAVELPDAAQGSPWPELWITEAATGSTFIGSAVKNDDGTSADTSKTLSPLHGFMKFLQAVFAQENKTVDGAASALPTESLHDLFLQSPLLLLPSAPSVLELSKTENKTTGKPTFVGPDVLKACQWTLTLVNETPVATQRDVAAALLRTASKSRDVWLTFEMRINALSSPGTHEKEKKSHLEASSPLSEMLLHSTHAIDKIPHSTAALPPKQRHEVEVAMQAAVKRASAATQRWLQDLPYRSTLVLVKYRRHLHKSRSWGLQLDGTDMTLVNFARLMVQYMYGSHSMEKQLMIEQALVASLAPVTSFPRNDKQFTERLFEEVPSLETLLNDLYRVVRINNTAVRQKAEAARVMAAFQASLDEKLSKMKNAEMETVPEQFFLTLTLERKGSSYRLCTPVPAATAATDEEESSTVVTTLASTKKTCTSRFSKRQQEQQQSSDTSAANTSVLQVDAELLDGLATSHCPVRPLTQTQLARSSVTLAINRLLLTEQTRNKWGLRLQHGTRRLKAVQQNRYFSFHVFAAKTSQATRIADSLRLVSTSRRASPSPANDRGDMQSEGEGVEKVTTPATSTTATAAHVIARSFYLYYVERVNQTGVQNHSELRRELLAAAQPPSQSPFPSSSLPSVFSSSSFDPIAVAALPPESVTLTVRQFPLLRFTATVRRGGVGEGSALGPVGLQVDKDMRVLSVFTNSPMARALTDAVGPLCSARRLIQNRKDDDETSASSELARPVSAVSAWDVIALPQLRDAMIKIESLTLRGVSEQSEQRKTPQPQTEKKCTWAYDFDEDEMAATAATSPRMKKNTNSYSRSSNANEPSVSKENKGDEVESVLRKLADASSHALQQLGKCSMVDGVHVLQASLLHEYAATRLATLHGKNNGTRSANADDEVRAGLTTLKGQLDAVYEQVRWEVVYALQSNRPLRTPADLAAAFAPGVAEETISVQQFVED